MTVNVTPVNDPSMGHPPVRESGEAGVAATVDTSGIGDSDGLSAATCSHQWMRLSGTGMDTTEADISGATSSTYTPTSDDNG